MRGLQSMSMRLTWRRARTIAAAVIPAAVLAGSASAQTPRLLVLSKTDHVLSLVDPATRQVVAQIPSGPDPHEVIASTDGRMAYISNYGGGAFHTITPVDLVQRRALPVIELGALRGPHGLDFALGKVWFTAEAAKAIGRYDPRTQQIDWVLGTGQDRTHMLVVSPDGTRIVTTNVSAGTVSVIEQGRGAPPGGPPPGGPPPGGPPPGGPPPGGPPRAEWTETVVPVGTGAEGIDVTPDGRTAWVANAGDGTISVIDLATKRVTVTLAADVRGANRIKFTPDGALAFVSTLGGPNVTVLQTASRTVVARIPVGRGAAGLQMQPDGARVYVACTPDDDIAVIDTRSLAVVGRITAGRQPDGLAWVTVP